MRRKKTLLKKAICPLMICAVLYGCSKAEPLDCPYTDLDWDTTEKELFEAKGDYLSSYNSTYGGTTYTYEGSYMDKNGTIKYMYDEDGVLMNVAWAYGSTDEDELLELYNKLYDNLEESYGESGYHTSEENNYGDTWEMKEGNILLSVMNTPNNKALQIAYVNPLNEEKKDKEGK